MAPKAVDFTDVSWPGLTHAWYGILCNVPHCREDFCQGATVSPPRHAAPEISEVWTREQIDVYKKLAYQVRYNREMRRIEHMLFVSTRIPGHVPSHASEEE